MLFFEVNLHEIFPDGRVSLWANRTVDQHIWARRGGGLTLLLCCTSSSFSWDTLLTSSDWSLGFRLHPFLLLYRTDRVAIDEGTGRTAARLIEWRRDHIIYVTQYARERIGLARDQVLQLVNTMDSRRWSSIQYLPNRSHFHKRSKLLLKNLTQL